MYHILIADDDAAVREQVTRYAEYAGMAVTAARNGTEALALCRSEGFDLLVLEAMLPGTDGYSVLLQLRDNPKTELLPVIMLSAQCAEHNRVHALELGADDFMAKPFSPRELILRVTAIIRRTKGHSARSEFFRYRGLFVDFTARRVETDGKTVTLSPKEYELLCCFIRGRNTALERSRLLAEVWGEDFYGDARTLDTHVKKLRQNLSTYGRMIVTVRGVGYRFET